MVSSLAAQLAQTASLNTSLLVNRSRRTPTQSYLFSSREADQHDLDSIHALGANGLLQLTSIKPSLRIYQEKLFSDAAKATDRTLLPEDANAELNSSIEEFLPLLGPYLLEIPTGKVLEWLVRRFRINEFNVEAVLGLFMPYHESPHFTKMLSILHIKETSPFAPLLPHKTASTALSRDGLVNLMLQRTSLEFSRFVAGLLPSNLRAHGIHAVYRGLVAFHTAVLLEYLKRSQDPKRKAMFNEGTAVWFLQGAIEPLQFCADVEVESAKETLVNELILSSYLLLSAFSNTYPLSSEALASIIKEISSCAGRVNPKHAMRTFVVVCAAQDSTEDKPMSSIVVKNVLKLAGIDEELKEALSFGGSERFIVPLLLALVSRVEDEQVLSLLMSLISYPSLPHAVIRPLAVGLVTHVVEKHGQPELSDTAGPRIRSLLVNIQQRYPVVLQKSFESITAGEQENSEKTAIVEQILLSLSLHLPTGSGKPAEKNDLDMIVASTSADAAIRVIAVRDLYTKLSSGGDTDELESTRSALLTRVQDTNVPVLEALYANPAQLLPILLHDASGYITTVSRTLHSTAPPSRNMVKAHLTFIATHFYSAISQQENAQELQAQIFCSIFLPFLLFTKSRQKTATAVWEILESSEKSQQGGVTKYELLGGCVDAVRWEEDGVAPGSAKEGHKNAELMAKINLAIAGKISENMLTSKSSADHLNAILPKLRDENLYARALCYLVLRSLLSHLSGEHKIDTGLRILHAMGLETLEGMGEFMRGADNLQAFLNDASLGSAIYSKPSSRNTLHRLQAALLSMLPTIPRPAGATLDWLDTYALSETSAPAQKGRGYVQLMRSIYKLANSSSSLPLLSTYLLRVLFVALGDDSFRFLAGIWLSSDPSSSSSVQPLHYISLHHAAAFLEAHNAVNHIIDFQTVLPAVLVALQHDDRRMREAAVQCVAALMRLSLAKKPNAVYAYDVIYGEGSSTLQYLDWSDFCRYVQALEGAREHFVNDGSYLRVFQQQQLKIVKSESKKDTGFKQRVLCYLISHVISTPLPVMKVALLNSIDDVSNSVKFQMLTPTLESLIRDSSQFGTFYENFASQVLASIDESAMSELNDQGGSSWALYEKILRHFFRPGISAQARAVLAHHLRNGVFAGLKLERKVALCQYLLDLAQQSAAIATECRNILSNVLSEVSLIVQLLSALQPATADASQRAIKRAKVDQAANPAVQTSYALLSTLAEILSSITLPGSLELLTALLDTLNKVVHDAPSNAGEKVFVEQLLMSDLENVAISMPNDKNIAPAAIRLDVLVELIRVSENPQTFNQALLLMATLARLAPDAVLLNIMPIFTFMGSNVFHRDDTYSFRVVQKTIDSIVPVMVSSLKQSHSERLDLYIASRPFLRIFTDAANHIPRHRRTGFFSQLIDALGPEDFLAPICLLLVDKVSNRVPRQNVSDAQNSLSLPLTALQRYPVDLQISTLVELLHETHRLVDDHSDPATLHSKIFLQLASDDDRGSSATVAKRQAQSILVFVGLSLKNISSAPLADGGMKEALSSELLTVLLDLAVMKQSNMAVGDVDDVVKTARVVVNNALSIMSATNFVTGVLTVIQSGEPTVQEGALNLLAEQLANVVENTRRTVSPKVVKIVESIRNLLSAGVSDTLASACFNALNAIALTMCPGEESALTSAVPLAVNYVTKRKATSSALTAMLSLSTKLGPRIIPYFKDTVKSCVSILQSAGAESKAEGEASFFSTAIKILQSLLSSIPNFWSKAELSQVIDLYLANCSSASQSSATQISAFIKAVSKRAPSKVLIPLLCEMWPGLASGEYNHDKFLGYFNVLKRSIRAATRPIIAEFLRSLFKTFLEIFQLCASSPTVRDDAETEAISTFLEVVVKLNEASFKPLFRKLFDWAFTAVDSNGGSKKLVFCHIFSALLDYFKGLMTPYMSFLLQPFINLLDAYSKQSDSNEPELWLAIIQTLSKTFAHDDGVFWREDKLRQLSSSLIPQIAVCVQFNIAEYKTVLSECLIAIMETVTDDALLKKMNLDILMHTRSEDSRLRLYALTCSEALWHTHGGKLIGFVAETTTFIAEAAEDENDSVVREAHRLKNAVESVAGPIDA